MGLLRQSLLTLASRWTITLVNIPISLIIARGLGASGQGIYTAAITFPNLWAGIGLLGLDAAHTYYLARDRKALGPVVANSIIVFLVVSAVLFPSYVFFFGRLAGEKGATFRPYLLLSAVIVPLIVARHLLLGLYLGLGRVETYNRFLVVAQLALLVMVVLGILVVHGGNGLVMVLYQASILVFIVPSLLWLRSMLTTEDRVSLAPSRDLMRSSLSYGLRGHPGTVLTQFSYRFDMALVLRWLGDTALGYYSISVLMAEKLSHITASVQFVLFPRIAAATREEANRLVLVVCRQTLLWVGLAGLALYAACGFLIRLIYSDQYLPALAAARALIPGIVALSLCNVLSSYFSGTNRRFVPTLAMAAGFGVNLGLDFFWIRRSNILGAAWASTVAYATQSILMALFFWRVTGISPLRLIVPERRDFDLYAGALAKMRARRTGRA